MLSRKRPAPSDTSRIRVNTLSMSLLFMSAVSLAAVVAGVCLGCRPVTLFGAALAMVTIPVILLDMAFNFKRWRKG